MALFPVLGAQYYDEKDKAILARMEEFYGDAVTINQAFWSEADTDTRFYVGDQTVWNDLYGNAPANRRRQFSLNRIRRIVQMPSGHQRRNRKSTIVVPYENGDDQTADQYTKIFNWINQKEQVLETLSQSFEGALITGMNLLQLWVDFRNDPISGDIKVDNCSYNSFLIDPYFRKADLSDCRALWKRSFLTRRECISLLPAHADEIINMAGQDNRDGKFQFMPESYNYGLRNLLTYDEFYYRDYRTQKLLVDTMTGEATEWKSSDHDALKQFVSRYPQIIIQEQEVPTVNVAIVVEGKVLYNGANPLGIDRYPFVPVFGYFQPEVPYYPWRIQGMVRGLRDAQYLYNRRKVIELDILESQINSGFIIKENSLVNPQDVYMAGQGRTLWMKESAQMTDVQPIQTPQIPPSMIELSRILGEEISQISGVNEELLGSAVDEKAGILSMLRQGAGLTTLQTLFDQLDASQKLLGSLMLEVVQTNFTPGKVKKILSQEPSPQFYNKSFGRYDAAVAEGLNTTTQRQMQFAQLLQLREIGEPIPSDVLLQAATIQNKKELIDAIKAANQAQNEAEQVRMQSTLEEQSARTNLANARATADKGLGIERLSRVAENQELARERRAEAEKDRMGALLDMVKALKELDSIDLQQLEKLLWLSNTLKAQEASLDRGTNNNLATESPVRSFQGE
jgi:hypothetical protein